MKSDYADNDRPTNVRYLLVVATCLVAFFMYIDRACVSQMKKDIQTDLSVSDADMDWVFSAFFWSYALAQVPSGFLGKRFGLRHSLAVMLFTWSLCTAVCGLVTGLYSLLVARLAVGLAEAGAYPTAAALVSQGSPLITLQIRNAMTSEVILGQENVGKALALGMIIIVSVVMLAYTVIQRRTSKWMR